MILVGYGRVGQIVAQILRASNYNVTAIDRDPERIRAARQFGVKVYFGDVTRLDVLRMAGASDARAIFKLIRKLKKYHKRYLSVDAKMHSISSPNMPFFLFKIHQYPIFKAKIIILRPLLYILIGKHHITCFNPET